MELENFTMGMIIALFAIVIIIISIFSILIYLDIQSEFVPLLTLMGVNIGLIFIEIGIVIFYIGTSKGKFFKGKRLKNLLLELNSIRNTKDDVKKEYYSRKLDEKTRNRILSDLREEELKIKNKIELIKDNDNNPEEEEG